MQLKHFGRFVYIAFAAATALLTLEACRASAGQAVMGMGDILDAGANLAGDAAQALHDAGQALSDAGKTMRDGGSEAGAQSTGPSARSGSRIEVRVPVQDGADGSRTVGSPQLFDKARNEACSPGIAADGKTRCLPTIVAYLAGGYFANTGCSEKLHASPPSPCGAAAMPQYLHEPIASGCYAGALRVMVVGAEHEGAIYTGTPANCVAATRPAGYKFYLPGSEVPASSFVEFTSAGFEVLD